MDETKFIIAFLFEFFFLNTTDETEVVELVLVVLLFLSQHLERVNNDSYGLGFTI